MFTKLQVRLGRKVDDGIGILDIRCDLLGTLRYVEVADCDSVGAGTTVDRLHQLGPGPEDRDLHVTAPILRMPRAFTRSGRLSTIQEMPSSVKRRLLSLLIPPVDRCPTWLTYALEM